MYIPYCPTRLFSKELLYDSLYQLMIVPTGCLVHLKNVWIHPPKREITWGLNKNTVICVLNDKLGFTCTVKNKQTNLMKLFLSVPCF